MAEVLPVATTEPIGQYREGSVTVAQFSHEAGDHRYRSNTYYPDNQISPIRLHKTTPLGTYLNRGGYPDDMALAMAEQGSVVTVVGPEEGTWGSVFGLLAPGIYDSKISIDTTAMNNLAIVESMDEHEGGVVMPGVSNETGASRSGINAIAMRARAALFGREVIMVDSVAPCFAKAPDLEQKARIAFKQVPAEVPHTIFTLGAKQGLEYLLKSTHFDPRFLAQVAHILGALTEGMEDIIEETPRDAYMHVTTYSEDAASRGKDGKEFRRSLAGHFNTIHDRRPGTHMDIIDPDNIALHLGRTGRQAEIMATGRTQLDPEIFDYIAGPRYIPHPHHDNVVIGLFRGISRRLPHPPQRPQGRTTKAA